MHISAHLDLDLVALETDDNVTCLLDLVAPISNHAQTRPGQAVVVVLDRSGSMDGPRLKGALEAITALVSRLGPNDSFGLITFDDTASVHVPVMTMSAHDIEYVRHALTCVEAGGSTDLSAGYLLGIREAKRAAAASGATVLLVSDGHANAGITSAAELAPMAAEAALHGVSTTTIGIGLGYDENLLVALSQAGRGGHRFAETVDEATAAIATELDGLLDKSVLNPHLRITPRDPEVVSGIHVINTLQGWFEGSTLVLPIGDLYSGEQRKVLVRFDVAGLAALGLTVLADVRLEYTALPAMVEHSIEMPVTVNVVPADIAAGRVPNPIVVVESAVQQAQASKTHAVQALNQGDLDTALGSLDGARKLLSDVVSALPDDVDAGALSSALEEIEELRVLRDSAEQRDVMFTSKMAAESWDLKSRGRSRRTP